MTKETIDALKKDAKMNKYMVVIASKTFDNQEALFKLSDKLINDYFKSLDVEKDLLNINIITGCSQADMRFGETYCQERGYHNKSDIFKNWDNSFRKRDVKLKTLCSMVYEAQSRDTQGVPIVLVINNGTVSITKFVNACKKGKFDYSGIIFVEMNSASVEKYAKTGVISND